MKPRSFANGNGNSTHNGPGEDQKDELVRPAHWWTLVNTQL